MDLDVISAVESAEVSMFLRPFLSKFSLLLLKCVELN